MLKQSSSKQNGFTLIEILIVLAIISMILTVVTPFSVNLYERYEDSLKVQKVMLYIASLKRESFLYSKENEISSLDGTLLVNGEKKPFSGMFVIVKKPFRFFKNGTSDGGEIEIQIDKRKYTITVRKPFGEISLEE